MIKKYRPLLSFPQEFLSIFFFFFLVWKPRVNNLGACTIAFLVCFKVKSTFRHLDLYYVGNPSSKSKEGAHHSCWIPCSM